MGKYVMALDAGTTSNRCILFDREGNMVSVAQKEFTQYFPKPGWVEHDAEEIWSTHAGRGCGGHAKGRGRALRISLPSASQTRERRPSSGTKIPESRSITPLSGSAGEPRDIVIP